MKVRSAFTLTKRTWLSQLNCLCFTDLLDEGDVPGPVAADPEQGPRARAARLARAGRGRRQQGRGLRRGQPAPGLVRLDVRLDEGVRTCRSLLSFAWVFKMCMKKNFRG